MTAALERMYRELRPYAFAIAYRMLGSVSEAEDVVSDAFLRLTQVGEGRRVRYFAQDSELCTSRTHRTFRTDREEESHRQSKARSHWLRSNDRTPVQRVCVAGAPVTTGRSM